MSFHHPSIWFLLALLLLPIFATEWWRRRGGLALPTWGMAHAVGRGFFVRTAGIVPLLRVIGVVLLIVALARPQQADEQTRVRTEGVAIGLVVDRSGSMEATDFVIDGRRVMRIEAVQHVVEEFVTGGESLPGRANDLIGVVAFGSYADTVCPMTIDHEHVVETIRAIRLPRSDDERATAIGDAIGLAVERMHALDERIKEDGGRSIRGKVIVLLTDGEQTAGELQPVQAAKLAQAYGIRIYTIGAGTDQGTVGGGLLRRRVSIDEETLRQVAAATGGAYFRAQDTEALRDVYAKIDELERTELRERRYTDYHESAVAATHLGSVTVPPVIAVALGLLLLETLLGATRYRRLT